MAPKANCTQRRQEVSHNSLGMSSCRIPAKRTGISRKTSVFIEGWNRVDREVLACFARGGTGWYGTLKVNVSICLFLPSPHWCSVCVCVCCVRVPPLRMASWIFNAKLVLGVFWMLLLRTDYAMIVCDVFTTVFKHCTVKTVSPIGYGFDFFQTRYEELRKADKKSSSATSARVRKLL